MTKKLSTGEILRRRIFDCEIDVTNEFIRFLALTRLRRIDDAMIYRAYAKYCGLVRQKTDVVTANVDIKGATHDAIREKIRSHGIEANDSFLVLLRSMQIEETDESMVKSLHSEFLDFSQESKTESPKARLIDTETKGEA